MLRRSFLIPCALLAAGLVALPACKKKVPDAGGGDGGPAVAEPPAAVKSDHFVFARLDAKQIRTGPVFTELKGALAKAGEGMSWDELEGKVVKDLGFKLTDVDTVVGVITEPPQKGPPPFVVIVTAAKAIPKGGAFGLRPGAQPDARGLYEIERNEVYAHFPDDKTVAIVHASVVTQYLGGYGKDRAGWPLTPDLTRAAAGHTLYVTVKMDKLPPDALGAGDRREFGDLLAAKGLTVQANLRGKELTVTGRASFADAASATKAQAKGREFIKMATGEIANLLADANKAADLGAVAAVVKEADQMLKGAKLEVSGSDLTLAASYKANFDFAKVAADMGKLMSGSESRSTSFNNLKNIAIAVHNYHDVYGKLPADIVDPRTGQPLLSWRVQILPFIEQDNVFRQFKLNEPWDSPNNKPLSQIMIRTFTSGPPVKGEWGMTNYRGISGPGTIFDPTARNGVRITDITDGTSNTIMLIETAEMVPWAKPGDFAVPAKGALPKIIPLAGQTTVNVATADGAVRPLRLTTPEATLRMLFTRNDGMVPTNW